MSDEGKSREVKTAIERGKEVFEELEELVHGGTKDMEHDGEASPGDTSAGELPARMPRKWKKQARNVGLGGSMDMMVGGGCKRGRMVEMVIDGESSSRKKHIVSLDSNTVDPVAMVAEVGLTQPHQAS